MHATRFIFNREVIIMKRWIILLAILCLSFPIVAEKITIDENKAEIVITDNVIPIVYRGSTCSAKFFPDTILEITKIFKRIIEYYPDADFKKISHLINEENPIIIAEIAPAPVRGKYGLIKEYKGEPLMMTSIIFYHVKGILDMSTSWMNTDIILSHLILFNGDLALFEKMIYEFISFNIALTEVKGAPYNQYYTLSEYFDMIELHKKDIRFISETDKNASGILVNTYIRGSILPVVLYLQKVGSKGSDEIIEVLLNEYQRLNAKKKVRQKDIRASLNRIFGIDIWPIMLDFEKFWDDNKNILWEHILEEL